jgi:hypothetical protein
MWTKYVLSPDNTDTVLPSPIVCDLSDIGELGAVVMLRSAELGTPAAPDDEVFTKVMGRLRNVAVGFVFVLRIAAAMLCPWATRTIASYSGIDGSDLKGASMLMKYVLSPDIKDVVFPPPTVYVAAMAVALISSRTIRICFMQSPA